MTDNAESITDTLEQNGLSCIVNGLQARAVATVNRAQRRIKSFLSFITNDSEICRFIHEENCQSVTPKLTGIANTVARISNSPFYSPSANSAAPYGYFCSRPVIGDCSPISGGIYLSTQPCEALVVDEKYDSLKIVLKDFRGRIAGVIGQNTLNDHQLLKFMMRYVREVLRYDEEAVAELNKQLKGSADRKVALDSYINAGSGAARHLVLLAGFLLEGLKRRGMAIGNVSIDTSQNVERLIYTSTVGDLFVLDFTKAQLEAGH